MRRFRALGVALALIAAAGMAAAADFDAAPADQPEFTFGKFTFGDRFELTYGIELGAGGFVTENTNFGFGRVDLATGTNTGDAKWAEGYVEPWAQLVIRNLVSGEIYGAVSVVSAGTAGDGDAGGFTNDGTDIDIERGYGGWRSKAGEPEGSEWVLDISFGRQDLHIGDGWLIWDGNFDTFGDKAYWLAPRSVFQYAGIVKAESTRIGLTGFAIRGDKHQDHSELAGGDGVFRTEWGSLGVMYASIFDSDNNFFIRDGMDIVSVRAHDVKVAAFPNLVFAAEYTEQFGSGSGFDFDARAFYGQATYTFANLPWTPAITYRYAHFTGDGDPDDSKVKAFDPLFYGFSAGWGTWFQGEVTGEYLLFNSNQRNHMVKLALAPTESLEVGAIYYHFDLDKKNYFGTPVTSRNFTDEVNFYADWTVSDNVFISGAIGAAFPNKAAKQAFGDDEDFWIFELYTVVNF